VKWQKWIIGLGFLGIVGLISLWPKASTKEVVDGDVPFIDFEFYSPNISRNMLLVMLHGGSWQVGEKGQLLEVGKYFASHGLSVVNMNYRLAPRFTYDAPLKDIAAVIGEVETDLAKYQLDVNYKLILLGFSAGGHLATDFCLKEADYLVRQAEVCVGLAGIYDLQRIKDGADGILLVDAVATFLGNVEAKTASPQYTVKTGEQTKFVLIRGEKDTVVSSQQQQIFSETLKQLGVAVEAMEIPGKDHLGIFNTISNDDEVAKAILEAIE
jgi:acetyl esterase/lipase